MSVLIPVENIRRHFDPLATPPWGCAPITAEEVQGVVDTEGFLTERHPDALGTCWSRDAHIARIAFFVAFGISDPLEIDVGAPVLGCVVAWPIQDGNHRLAAAILRKDAKIPASVSGQLSYARELFGVSCQERVRRRSDSVDR